MQDELIDKIAQECDALVRAKWTYTLDGPKDNWADYSEFYVEKFDLAMANNPWAASKAFYSSYSGLKIKDDCDAMSFTTLCLMARKGVPINKLYLGVVYGDENQTGRPRKNELEVNHAIGMVKLEKGWRIVGDTFERTYMMDKPPFKIPHIVVMYGELADPKNLKKWVP